MTSKYLKELQNDYSIQKRLYNSDIYYPVPDKTGILIKNGNNWAFADADKQNIYIEHVFKSDTRVQNAPASAFGGLYIKKGSELDPFRQSIGKFWGYTPDNDGTLAYYYTAKDSNTPAFAWLGDETAQGNTISFPTNYKQQVPSIQNYCVTSTGPATEFFNDPEIWPAGSYADTLDMRRKATRVLLQFSDGDLIQNRFSMISLFCDIKKKYEQTFYGDNIITKDDLPEVIKIKAIIEILKGELKLVQAALENMEAMESQAASDPDGVFECDPDLAMSLGISCDELQQLMEQAQGEVGSGGGAGGIETDFLLMESDLINEDLDDNGIPKGKIPRLEYLLDQIPDPAGLELRFPPTDYVDIGEFEYVPLNWNHNSVLKKSGTIFDPAGKFNELHGFQTWNDTVVEEGDDVYTELFKEVATNMWETFSLYTFNQTIVKSNLDAFYDFDLKTYRYPEYVNVTISTTGESIYNPNVLNREGRYFDSHFAMNLPMSSKAMTFAGFEDGTKEYVEITPVYNYYSRYYEESTKQGEVNVIGSDSLYEIPETFYPSIYDVGIQKNQIGETAETLISAKPNTENDFSKFKFEDLGYKILNCGLPGLAPAAGGDEPLSQKAGIREYFNILFNSIKKEDVMAFDSLKNQFPFYIDIEFRTDKKNVFSNVFNDPGITKRLMGTLISNFFDYTKQNTNIFPSKEEVIGFKLDNAIPGGMRYYDPYDTTGYNKYVELGEGATGQTSAKICANNIYTLVSKNQFIKYVKPTETTATFVIDSETTPVGDSPIVGDDETDGSIGFGELVREFNLNEWVDQYLKYYSDKNSEDNQLWKEYVWDPVTANASSKVFFNIVNSSGAPGNTNALASQVMNSQIVNFSDEYAESVEERFRNYDKILQGIQAYDETLFYRIEKRAVLEEASHEAQGPVLQNIWFVKKDTDDDIIKYIDTQVKYGKKYEYIVYAYQIVVGTKYGFQFENYLYKDAPWTDNYGYLPIPEDTDLYNTVTTGLQNLEETTEGESTTFGTETEINIPGFQQSAEDDAIEIFQAQTPKAKYFLSILETANKRDFEYFGDESADLVYNGQLKGSAADPTKNEKYGSNVFFTQRTYAMGEMYEENLAIFDVICEPDVKLVEIPIHKKVVAISDAPPTPPEVDIIPLNGEQNKVKINFYPGSVDRELIPVPLLEQDDSKFLDIRKAQGRDILKASAFSAPYTPGKQYPLEYYVEPRLMFKTDDHPIRYEIYKTETPPHTVGNLVLQRIKIDAKKQSSYTDTIEQNKKYYYLFRSIDVHENPSNPSPVYQVEMVENSGVAYPVISIYTPPQELKQIKSKPFKRYLKIDPAPLQNTLNMSESTISGGKGLKDADSAVETINNNIVLGEKEDKIFNFKQHLAAGDDSKEFKFRIKSKHTGKAVDLNIKFKMRTETVNQNIPSCGDNGFVEYNYPEITSDDLE
tara:strand:- start:5949 stop:10253 length:4305 start_codon:yes stop_codon:yes gene_type:complete